MKPIKVVIIDDEQDAIQLTKILLQKIDVHTEVTASFSNPESALDFLKTNQPDLILLDVEMPRLSGFELLEKLGVISFGVIFITAYDQYAIKAFRYQAIDYLIKPLSDSLLKEAIQRASANIIMDEQLQELSKMRKGEKINKLAVPTSKGILFISLDEICCIEAADNYSIIHFNNKSPVVTSKTLKDMHSLIDDAFFMRVHRQFVVNLNQVMKMQRTESTITLSNNMNIPISRDQKENLLDHFKMK